ncbi:hypothetical protein IWW38_001264 [Coemansia aciculifera]|uniref:Uncharacterized protein n=1 Tax=Coemansia aciculifera TaxID=417176 RepID=A0ACC1M6U3_9FUNG|nr:hypothetical protein IWW38_001264 [Coemansia aciculifera]
MDNPFSAEEVGDGDGGGGGGDTGLYIYASRLVPNTADTTDDGSDSDSDMDLDSDSYMGVQRARRKGQSRGRGVGGSTRGARNNSNDSSSSSNSNNGSETLRHWHRRAPLLPQRMATLVSRVSGATQLSLEITALFWEAIFDTISESTNSGVWLGAAAWEEVRSLGLAAASILSPLSSLNPRIVSRLVSSTTAAGFSVVNQSLAAAECVLEGGFTLYTQTVNMGLHAAGEYVRLIDALFGSTDTSRVLASFMHMCRREAFEKNPEIQALLNEHGVMRFGGQVVKTMVAWICLQVVTHGRSRPYRMELVHTNMRAATTAFCPRKFIDSRGRPLKTPDASRTPAAAATPRATNGVVTQGTSSHGIEVISKAAAAASSSEEEGEEGDAYYALSDQEGSSHLDPDWDQRLMEALRKLSVRNEKQAEQQRPPEASIPRSKSSLWSTLLMVRESAATAAVGGGGGGSDGSSSDSDPNSAFLRNGRRMSVPFESAPASLVSSPQLAATSDSQYLNTMKLDDSGGGGEESLLWLEQEFPRKPLLFNLARFIPVASSAYGHSFMKVLGLGHGMIDARALIDEFGDYEVGGQLSQSNSLLSIDATMSPHHHHHRRQSTQSPKLPRAQPMSSYHTHSAFNASRPESLRQYERRHFRAPSSATGRRRSHRRPPPVRRHRRRRPVSEHPNHFCFSQHTGIPLGDLLFSSYVPPIVPGVTNAASAQAEAVERKLRRRSKRLERENEMECDPAAETAAEAVSAPEAGGRGWMASIPIVGSIYQKLPSPLSALSAVPVIPGLVSRILGTSAETLPAQQPPPLPPRTSTSSGGEPPTAGQFRRFDKLRQRLVYRNPSIHALVHYIAVDHATRSIVLACRGTLGISDLFIDMICEYETIHLPEHSFAAGGGEGGQSTADFRVHSGMWHSALLLADPSSEVFKEVAEALRLYPEYGLVVTGHSLGGGVASLLTLLWSQPIFQTPPPPSTTQMDGGVTPGSAHGSLRQFVTTDKFGLVSQRPIHCFSFGSPCSTNATLSYYCRGLVTSVANANDVISFLSIGTCVDILNISAVLGRERGVAEKVVRRFLATQRTKIGKKLNWFDFDFSKLRAYSREDDSDDSDVDEDEEEGKKSPKPKKRRKRSDSASSLDDWYWSLVKTLRANMDSEKLYPPGDVFILAAPGDDEMADAQLKSLVDDSSSSAADKKSESSDDDSSADKNGEEAHLPVGLFYCPNVAERFSELRFTRNMFAHHLPSTYERRLAALVHENLPLAH